MQSKYGTELLSTGGTAKKLRDEGGLTVTDVSEFTGAAECLDGRVKTLHPKVHGGLLAVRGNDDHERQMKEQGMKHIDMTILNLYPFEETMKRDDATFVSFAFLLLLLLLLSLLLHKKKCACVVPKCCAYRRDSSSAVVFATKLFLLLLLAPSDSFTFFLLSSFLARNGASKTSISGVRP